MTTVACLGWGSLIWDQGDLPLVGHWRKDGPTVHVEFLRQSKDGRITLVLDKSASPVVSLWAPLKSADLNDAAKALGAREGIPPANVQRAIGRWFDGSSPELIPNLQEWAQARGVSGVVWTALPAKFGGTALAPDADTLVGYLRVLKQPAQDKAKEYIQRAPHQIDTPYRRRIVTELGWGATGE